MVAPAGTPDTARLLLLPVALMSGIATLIVPELAVASADPANELAVNVCVCPLQIVADAGEIVIALGRALMVTVTGADGALTQPVAEFVTITR